MHSYDVDAKIKLIKTYEVENTRAVFKGENDQNLLKTIYSTSGSGVLSLHISHIKNYKIIIEIILNYKIINNL